MVLKTTSNVKGLFKSGTAPLYRSLVTSLIYVLFEDPEGSPSKIAVEVLLCKVYGDKK